MLAFAIIGSVLVLLFFGALVSGNSYNERVHGR